MNNLHAEPFSRNAPISVVLLVTANKKIKSQLKQLFESEGYVLQLSHDALSAARFCRRFPQCLVILDLLLPDKSGYGLCRRLLKEHFRYPIIALGPRSDLESQIGLLELGVTDYVSMPFDARELLARVRAALRCYHRAANDRVFTFANVTVDVHKMEVRRGGKTVVLGKKGFDMLKFMIANQRRVIPRQEFLEKIWNYKEPFSTRAVDQQIVRLRRTLETDPAQPVHFRTVHSIGYKFIP